MKQTPHAHRAQLVHLTIILAVAFTVIFALIRTQQIRKAEAEGKGNRYFVTK